MTTADLASSLAEFQREPFPEGSSDDRVDELRAELALFDGHVIGLVTRLLAGDLAARSSLSPDLVLRERMIALARDESATTRRDASALLTYLDQLELLIRRAVMLPSSGLEPGPSSQNGLPA